MKRGSKTSFLALTVAVVAVLYVSISTGSIEPFCTTWNTNVTAVCSAISAAHNFLSAANIGFLQNCAFLTITPHCCKQLCQPARSGTCDYWNSGACICNGPGTPETCNAFFNAGNKGTDQELLGRCRAKCLQAGGTCRTPAYITDSINYICVCYCPN